MNLLLFIINNLFQLAKESKLWLAELADRVRVLLVKYLYFIELILIYFLFTIFILMNHSMFLEIVNIKNYPKQAISQSIYPSKTVTAVELREKEK